MFQLSVSPEYAPDQAEIVEIEFESGIPVSVNGERMSPAGLIATLNDLGGKHGIGRADMVEGRLVGMKSRGVYETPGGQFWLLLTGKLNPWFWIRKPSTLKIW